MRIDGRKIGPGQPTYIIAELSANHEQNFALATEAIQAARDAGADAIKFQTYEPRDFVEPGDELEALYEEAYTPPGWFPALFTLASDMGITAFSTPFSVEAVDLLETAGCPAYKLSSFDCTNMELVRAVKYTGKPIIASVGCATSEEVGALVRALQGSEFAILHCISAYPAPPIELYLDTIQQIRVDHAPLIVGYSDHSPRALGSLAAVAAVARGARIIERHFMVRGEPLDGPWSLPPDEFASMVEDIRLVENMGGVEYGPRVCEREWLWRKQRAHSG